MLYSNQTIRTPIVPPVVSYYDIPGERQLDYPAICCFAALGFFPDDDTYFTNRKAFRPATDYVFNEHGEVLSKSRWFEWHYQPRDISFRQALNEFAILLEGIVSEETRDKKVWLPVSGGLDSRTLAAVVAHRKDIQIYSYHFENGVRESDYGAAIANALSFPFYRFIIPRGYLWNRIDELAQLNGCYAEFLNPRQMAVLDDLRSKGDIFLLGHGGDLFFDSMGVPDETPHTGQLDYLIKKLIKPEALELGQALWREWTLAGDFKDYLISRIEKLLNQLNVDNANARLRAFKTEYYVARWTAVNLALFQSLMPVSVPFFHDAMCRFICTIPEKYLAARQLEIEYLKEKNPALARIPWQKVYPCNVVTHHRFNDFDLKIQRGWIKVRRELLKYVLGIRSDTANWELQFTGKENELRLQKYLTKDWNSAFISGEIPAYFLERFKKQRKPYVHAVSMLLTMHFFQKHFLNKQV
jgi:asparagine synthetase B (glutamine-hydrolysing)